MKKSLLFSLLLVASSYPLVLRTQAQSITATHTAEREAVITAQKSQQIASELYKPAFRTSITLPQEKGQMATIPLKEADICEVEVVFQALGNSTPLKVTLYNAQEIFDVSYKPNLKIKVPKGTYDMHALFQNKAGVGLYFVFKEQVKIDKDQQIVFDQSTATRPIIIKSVDENNQELFPDIYSGGSIYKKGNLVDMGTTDLFVLDGVGVVETVFGGAYRVKEIEAEFFTNPVSERYHYFQVRSLHTEKKDYFVHYQGALKDISTLTNDPTQIALHTQKFLPTKAGLQMPQAHIQGYQLWVLFNNKIKAVVRSYNPGKNPANGVTDYYIGLPMVNGSKFNAMVSPLLGDTYNDEYAEYRFTVGIPVMGSKGKLQHVHYGYDIYVDYTVPEGGGEAIGYPGHPKFSFSAQETQPTYGGSAPMASTKFKYYNNGESTIGCVFLGRFGEQYETDYRTYEEKSSTESGRHIHTIKSKNAQVDGLEGGVDVTMNYNPQQDDKTPPTPQMLTFRHSNGARTDRFASAEEGRIELAAGDFNYHDNEDLFQRYFDCKEITAKLSFSPYHEEKWTSLSLTEDPSGFHMPGFGYFYSASLKAVGEKGLKARKGWFDIKIELTDKAGNTHTQTISPAFQIANLTSIIEPIQADDAYFRITDQHLEVVHIPNAEISVYTLEGQSVLQTHAQKLSLALLPKGCYIVKASNGAILITTKLIL